MGKRFLHNRAAVITVAIVLLIGLIGILAPVLAPHDPYANDILNKFAPYSMEDVYKRQYGFRACGVHSL